MNERRDVMGWTDKEGYRIDVVAWGSGDFGMSIDGVAHGCYRIDREGRQLVYYEHPWGYAPIPVSDSRMAALTLLDRRVTQAQAQAGEVTQ